jgi:hypothetical protein
MRFPVSWSVSLAAVAVLVVSAGILAGAQTPGQAPSGQSTSTPPSTAVQAPAPAPAPTYISIDPLANVRYDNKWDVSVGMAYRHIKAGPNLLQGANLGGVDLTGSYYLRGRWRLEATGRGYLGTSGAAPNTEEINGPFIMDYIFAGGVMWLGPHNKHGAISAHVLGGGAWGIFEQNLRGNSPEVVGFYNDQIAPAAIMGGHFDLNRSARWVFRVTPDAILTNYSINYGPKTSQIDINFAISVGVQYKFKQTK